jgi:uncharacterized protein (UPF0261 family)
VAASPAIALLGTLDTKGEEIAYVRDRLRALGARPLVIDTGILGEPAGCTPDVTRAEVAAADGDELEAVRAAGSRGAAVERMLAGVRAVCLRLYGEGNLDGALCLGGAEGAIMGAGAMHALPVGVPKLIVSPSASGRRAFAPFMGETDTTVMHSVVDILGLHTISRAIFDNAAAAVVAMAREGGGAVGALGERTVGVTMLGQTTPGVMRLRERLLEAGHAPVVFHANGVGGPAMEKLAATGALAGVVDYTLSELANSLMNGIHATGPERLRIAGRNGLPQVVVPGCCDFFNQGARDTVPERFRDRKSYYHNPVATLVRLSAEEGVELGRMIAGRLADSVRQVHVVVPTRGFSLVDAVGGDLYDPAADRAFIDALRVALRSDFAYEEVDAHVDDPAFADLVADRYLTLVKETVHAG